MSEMSEMDSVRLMYAALDIPPLPPDAPLPTKEEIAAALRVASQRVSDVRPNS